MPAAINYTDSNISGTFYSVDIAVKVKDWGIGKTSSLLLFPVVEYHSTSAASAEANKISAGFNAEYYLNIPFFVFQGKFVCDLEADQTSGQASVLASL